MTAVLFGAGDGTLLNRRDYPVHSSPGPIASGDLNGDGAADLAVANPSFGTASILMGACSQDPGTAGVENGLECNRSTDVNGIALTSLG